MKPLHAIAAALVLPTYANEPHYDFVLVRELIDDRWIFTEFPFGMF